MGNKTLVDRHIGPTLIHVQGKSIVWVFSLYHLVGIELILGMNWLLKNRAIIEYEKEKYYYQERITMKINIYSSYQMK